MYYKVIYVNKNVNKDILIKLILAIDVILHVKHVIIVLIIVLNVIKNIFSMIIIVYLRVKMDTSIIQINV